MGEPRVVLVTGASRGIGEYLARRFAQRGDTVVGCARSSVGPPGNGFEYCSVDVTDESQVRRLVRGIARDHQRLDVAINCAGVASMNHVLLTPGEAARRVMEVNFLGTFLVSREAAKVMARRGSGVIVNFSTVAVPLNLEGEATYVASKSAVEAFTRVFAKEITALGLRCNAVAPGPVETDLIRGVPSEKMDALLAQLSPPRHTTLEEVGDIVEGLTDADSEVTGKVVYLGGVG